ncbi:MAG: hypothetical protein M0P71_12840 [Melioribacteraceae bacterium]|jgi:predicted ribosome-associated RNA-binding protein Tma20|nr:hypothetical protein [Melioribacteraceae bacterium]
MKIETFFTPNTYARHQVNYKFTEKQLQKRLQYFQQELLKDKNIKSIKKENSKVIISYDDEQIFTCSGWLVDNSTILEFEKKKKGIFY